MERGNHRELKKFGCVYLQTAQVVVQRFESENYLLQPNRISIEHKVIIFKQILFLLLVE